MWTEQMIMRRLHQIVSGSNHGPFKKETGWKWQLDESNDWFAELNGGTLTLIHRYSESWVKGLSEWVKIYFS
jgi:hypothetical protein